MLRSSLTSVDHVQEREWTILLNVMAMRGFTSVQSRVVSIAFNDSGCDYV